MSRKAKTNGSTALAMVVTAPPALHAHQSARARTVPRCTHATRRAYRRFRGRVRSRRSHRPHRPRPDLQRIQARLAAIAARQQRANATGGEPKVAKFVDQTGMMIGSVSAYLATERALELFAPVQQADYVGWNGSGVGPKGQDDTLLAGYEIVDDPLGAQNAAPTVDDDGAVCLHTDVEAYEDEPTRGACVDCGEEFGLRSSPADRHAADAVDVAAEEEPAVDAHDDAAAAP